MKITDDQIDQDALAKIGAEANDLIRAGNIRALVERFGYALAFGRDPVAAVEADLATSRSRIAAEPAAKDCPCQDVVVRYFEPNSANLFAVIECSALVENCAAVRMDLIVTSAKGERYVYLEDIFATA
jgi:hypothetical protein